MLSEKNVSRRKYIAVAGGAAAAAVIGGAAYYLTLPGPPAPTPTPTPTPKPTPTPAATPTPTPTRIKLKYLGPKAPDPTPVGASEYGLDLLKVWEEENNVDFEAEVLAWPEVEPKATTEFLAGGYHRDIVYACTTQAKFSRFVHDHNKFLASPLKDDIPKSTMDTNTYPKGKLNSMHFCLSLELLFYNKRILWKAGLERPPESWNELIEWGLRIKERQLDVEPYGAINWGGTYIADSWVQFLNQTGGTSFDEDLYPAFNNDAGERALQFAQDITVKHKIVAPESFTWMGIADNTRAFEIGKVAMTPNWTFQYKSSLNPEHSKIVGDAWMCILPGDSEMGIRSGSVDGQDTLAITLESPHPDLAWKYIEFTLSEPVQRAMAFAEPEKGGGWMPIRKSVLADPELQAREPVAAVLLEQSNYKFDNRYPPEWSAIADAITPTVHDCYLGKIKVKDALNTMEDTMLKIIKESRGGA